MGLKELFKDSVTEIFTYRTTKLVKTNDKFLVTLHFIFMGLISVFALVSILLSHNYMTFELPSLYVTTTFDEWRSTAFTVDETYNAEIATNATEAYCNTGYVTWRRNGKVFDDDYMTNVKCVADFMPNEYIWPFERGNGFRFGTFLEEYNSTVSCTVPTAANFKDAGCTRTDGSAVSYMIAGAELVAFPLEIMYQTRTGSLSRVNTFIVDGTEYDGASETSVSITSFLAASGINSLDEENVYMVGDQGSVTGLPYRISGLNLNIKVEFKNTYFNAPLKTTTQATLSGEQVQSEHYTMKADTIYLRGQTGDTIINADRINRLWSTVQINFVSSGEIGTFDLFALALAITNAFVLIGMATTIVDTVGVMTSETFLDDKYEDDGERLGLEMMLANIESEGHPGVPFEPNDLRLPDATGAPGLSYERTLTTLLEEVREIQEQLSLLPEDENELRLITTGKAEPEEFRKLRLVYVPDPLSHQANDKKYVPPEIALHDGQQTIGRGMGGVENKGVSRQQLSVAVIKERIRVKSLHEGPGVWRQSTGRWEMLQVGKAAVLSVGDRLCYRMREGKIGGHEGVFVVDYQDSRLDTCTVFGIPLG